MAFKITRRVLLESSAALGIGLATLIGSPQLLHAADAPSGTFVWGKAADARSLDPAIIDDADSSMITRMIYDTLVRFKAGTTELIPGLAESWDVSEDGKAVTFHLRRGVKFHDGSDFNAAAVKMNFDRWSDKGSKYRPDDAHMGNNFLNWGTYMIINPEKPLFKSLDVVDDYTVVLRVNYAYAPLVNTIGMFPFAIVSPKSLESDPNGVGDNPVGTGPFKFKSWVRDSTMSIVANPESWSGVPKVAEVVFKPIPDATARFLQLKGNAIQGMGYPNSDDVVAARSDPSLNVVEVPNESIAYLNMFNATKPFDDVRVRQAVAMAIDKQSIATAFYTSAKPATQYLPSTVMGYDPDLVDYSLDVEKAKALLAEAGYPDGFEIELWYMGKARNYYPDPKSTALAMADQLSKIGIKVNVKTEEWSQYLPDINKNKFQMWFSGWANDNGDPNSFFNRWLAWHDPENGMRSWKDPDTQALLQEAAVTINRPKREEMYKQAVAILHEQTPWVPVVAVRDTVLLRDNVKGFIGNAIGISYDFTELSVSN